MTTSMFELLMDLPLFKGVSLATLSQVVGETKFHFLKYPAGETIIRERENCTHITFVIAGSVRLNTVNANGRFAISRTLKAPAVIAPDFLYGRITSYPCSVTAIDDVSILKISKADYARILNTDPVFMINYLNTLSVNAQKSVEGILSLTTGEIDERIASDYSPHPTRQHRHKAFVPKTRPLLSFRRSKRDVQRRPRVNERARTD